jgi:GDP-L-fucose synthase
MQVSDKIYVAGHQGLLGSALVRRLKALGHNNLLLRSHHQLDLTDQHSVQDFFAEERPAYVFLAAAKVGGILANSTYPAEFISQNLRIQANVIDSAYRTNVMRLLFLGSSCIYPKHAPQPIKEEYLLSGPLEPTNRPYAIAKISGIEMCSSYNKQYATRFLAAMPTNLYGPGDRYDLHDSHVVPALIRKMHEAKIASADQVVVWGSGRPRREFLYSDDAADACIFLMNLPESEFGALVDASTVFPIINVGCGEDLAIMETATVIAETVGFKGNILCDRSKPDGTPRKLLDVTRLRNLGWSPRTSLRDGLARAYTDFKMRQNRVAEDRVVST